MTLNGAHWFEDIQGRRVAAKSDNFIKNWLGGWSHYNTAIAARAWGYVSGSSGSCSVQFNFNPGMYGKYKSKAKHIEHEVPVDTKTTSGWVHGDFAGADGLSHTLVITW